MGDLLVALQLDSIDLDMKMHFSVLTVLTLGLLCGFYSEKTAGAPPGPSGMLAVCMYS